MISIALGIMRAVPLSAWAIVAALAWGGVQHHKATRAGAALLKLQQQTADLREKALHGALLETTRRLAAQQEAADAAETLARRARADADAAGAAGQRLRAAAAAAARAAACDPAAAASGPADRLADVLGQCVDRYRDVAAAADRAVIAGSECAARYDALKP